jgi:hypothetical protein
MRALAKLALDNRLELRVALNSANIQFVCFH